MKVCNIHRYYVIRKKANKISPQQEIVRCKNLGCKYLSYNKNIIIGQECLCASCDTIVIVKSQHLKNKNIYCYKCTNKRSLEREELKNLNLKT
jgi:hypothetical protein